MIGKQLTSPGRTLAGYRGYSGYRNSDMTAI